MTFVDTAKMSLKLQLVLSIIFAIILDVNAQFYEDRRCRCVCPSPSVVLNHTKLGDSHKLFIANVPPNKCTCTEMIIKEISEEIAARLGEYCPRCECTYETRNTTVILVVVVMVLWVLMMLAVYMAFLMCLDPLIRRKRTPEQSYREDGGDEARMLLVPGEDDD